MKKHKGKRLFITGIPTAGKSYLAKKLVEAIPGGHAVHLDDFRELIAQKEDYRKWTDYLNWDEKKYLTEVSPERMWNNLVAQSEALWPEFLEKIEGYSEEQASIVFECVNILPHLAKKSLNFPGVVLIGSSCEQTLERIRKEKRWSDDPILQEFEAKMFFEVERPRYKLEGEKCGYPVFETAGDAFQYGMSILKK